MSTERFQQYIDYINNTGMGRVPIEIFDDDHEPVGPMVRADMQAAGLITVNQDGIAIDVESIATARTTSFPAKVIAGSTPR